MLDAAAALKPEVDYTLVGQSLPRSDLAAKVSGAAVYVHDMRLPGMQHGGIVPAQAQTFEMGDRTAVPPYAYADQRITLHDMAPILRASWLRGVSALPNSFAHESFIDELATAAAVDPVAYRLRHLPDARAAELVRATADRAGWLPHTTPQRQPPPPMDAQGDAWLPGQGFAYARYVHSQFPGFGAAWAAWVADVQVNPRTGQVHVSRVVVGHDAGLMINPRGVQQQVHGNVLQTTSRAMLEQVRIDPLQRTVASRDWGSYPILQFNQVPVVDVPLMPRPGEPALGVGESASVPGTAAIANAIFDATGVRLRNPPFTPEVVCPTPAAGRWPRPSAPFTPPTSRPTRPPASASGRSRPSSGRCGKASRATATTCTRPSPTPHSARSTMRT